MVIRSDSLGRRAPRFVAAVCATPRAPRSRRSRPRGLAPAAGLVTNVSDLAKFAMWQPRVLESGDDVLRSATLREMQRVL